MAPRPLPNNDVRRFIYQYAPTVGLDPMAVSAIGMHEGGLRRNAVGDHGTSFGPFQLHEGGALPSGRGAGWAGSNAGLKYAMDQMSRYAKGKTGAAAVSSIARDFERPADPAGEISDAMTYYGGKPTGNFSFSASPSQATRASQASVPGIGGDPTSTRSNALMQYALAQSNALMGGDTSGTTNSLLSFLQAVPQEVSSPSQSHAAPANTSAAPPGSSLSKDVAGKLKLAIVPGQWDTRPGIQVNSQILPSVLDITKKFGVKVNSGYRSAEHNAAVGGASHSDHLGGNAVDFTGDPSAMHRLYNWAQGRFPYIEPWDQAGGNHVHISFIR